MWSLHWSEKPEERDRNPSASQIRITGWVPDGSPKPYRVGSNPTIRAKYVTVEMVSVWSPKPKF